MNRTQPVLEVRNLRKIYELTGVRRLFRGPCPFTAVDDISFSLQPGEILGFLGPNGAGKTTTIQMLLGTLRPTSGTIRYFDKDFSDHRSAILEHIGFASTYVNLPKRLTITENLDVYGRLYAIPDKKRKEKIKELLDQFELWHLKDHEVGALSAGQTARVMLAKAFLANPKIILLDEPTAALDPDIAHEVRNFIFEQQQLSRISILFASHNMQEVTEVCDRVVVLQHGKIFEIDTPYNLARRISSARLELMIGDGLRRTVEYAQELSLPARVDGRFIEIELDETEIASFLAGLAGIGVSYDQISIKNPSLEDYFLHIARMGKKKES